MIYQHIGLTVWKLVNTDVTLKVINFFLSFLRILIFLTKETLLLKEELSNSQLCPKTLSSLIFIVLSLSVIVSMVPLHSSFEKILLPSSVSNGMFKAVVQGLFPLTVLWITSYKWNATCCFLYNSFWFDFLRFSKILVIRGLGMYCHFLSSAS